MGSTEPQDAARRPCQELERQARSSLAGSRFADVTWVAETGSTNTDALSALRERTAGGDGRDEVDLVVVADHQSAGRGRLGRVWQAPARSSLLLTVGTTAQVADDRRGLLLTAMALAAIDACEQVCGFRPGLKWPNDLVVVGAGADGGDRKLGGVLAEAHPFTDGTVALVVGLGLNCNWGAVPDELSEIATSLDIVTGSPVDRVELAVAILRNAEDTLATLVAPDGPSSLVGAARENSATLGREVRIELDGGSFDGRAVDLDHDGALVVEVDGARRTVLAGDVVHLRSAGDGGSGN